MKYFIAAFQLLLGLLFLYSMVSGNIDGGIESAISTVIIIGVVLTVVHVVRTPKVEYRDFP